MERTIEGHLREIYIEALRLSVEPRSIGDEGLVDALGIDSISALEILIWVENEFDVRIEDEDLSADLVDSIPTLAAYLRDKAASLPEGSSG